MPAENYSYDGVGNRTASQLSASYSYQPFNKLTSTATATYSYDNNGNLISKSDTSGTTTYTFNEENQLAQVTLPNSLTVSYIYDGLGRRIQRTTSAGASERYVYDNSDVLIDLNADWSVATTYLNDLGIDNHLRQTSAATGISYMLNDPVDSTVVLTDVSGNPREQILYDSFGNSPASTLTRYTYTGRERDPDTGLFHYRARFYDPALGRFINEDPVGLYAGINQYAYVSNSPLAEVDPFGLQGLAPLSSGRRRRINPSRDELERMMNPNGKLSREVKRELDRGCIGFVSAYQGMGELFPESAPGTRCYLRRSQAIARKCDSCCENFVFAKQGQWSGKPARPNRRTGQVDTHSISIIDGHYNYVVYFPTTQSYGWMNHGTIDIPKFGPQQGSISRDVPKDPQYPNTIWCSTCKPKK